MTEKAIEFKWVAPTPEVLSNWLGRLKNLCENNSLELYKVYPVFGDCIECSLEDGSHKDYRITLQIIKHKGITYDGIYSIVNSIKPVYFKKVNTNREIII